MERTAEFPDQHVVNLAEQFLDTAELLLSYVPSVVAPSPLRVNAAFAIELFIKSLNSHWEVDESYAVTTEPNVRGHKLAELFEKLPEAVRDEIETRFIGSMPITELLTLYSSTFEIERYGFELQSRPYDNRTLVEIVELARFFRSYVTSLPTRRFAISS